MKLLRLQTKKPTEGYSAALHILLTALLPILGYIFVRLEFGWIAAAVVLLAKWRIFSVKIRHWPASIMANGVDILAGLSFVMFMVLSSTQTLQILWAALFALWLLVLKPQSNPIWVGIQALVAQFIGLTAIFLFWSDAPIFSLVLLTWGITYISARHFLTAFDAAMSRATGYAWAFFAGSVAWLSGHWLIFYGPIAQPALLIGMLGYGLASIYYLQHFNRLTPNVRRQFIAVMSAVVLFLIIFSDWSDKTI